MQPDPRRLRQVAANALFHAALWIAGSIGIAVPLGIVLYLFSHAGNILHPAFLLDYLRGSPLGSSGGILPAIAGSASLAGTGFLVAFPCAVGATTFLVEFVRSERLVAAFLLVAESLAAVPSIVYGLFGYAFFVVLCGMGTSLLAGGLVLALVMFPILLITAHASFQAVSGEFREATFSLGVDRTEWIFRVLFPKAASRVLAGVVLAVGHAMGSAAPVLFTAAVFFSRGDLRLDRPVMTLPTHLYFLVSEGVSLGNAYATATVLVLMLLAFNISAMALRRAAQENE